MRETHREPDFAGRELFCGIRSLLPRTLTECVEEFSVWKSRQCAQLLGTAASKIAGKIAREVRYMCNYSEMVAERAAAETAVDNIRSLMRHLNFTEEEAMDALEFTGEKRELYASMLEEERNTENP